MPFFKGRRVTAFACGRYHMLAIEDDRGTAVAYGWGSSVQGQLGYGSVS